MINCIIINTGRKCVSDLNICDTVEDCEDGSDEKDCQHDDQCKYPHHQCDQHLNATKCLAPEWLCNGKSDCLDGSDEGLLCGEDSCNNNDSYAQCSHLCYNSPDGFRCACPNGLQLDESQKNCTDQNPCNQWGTCSQFCKQTTPTKHKCFCHEDYVLLPDKFTCRSKDSSDPKIVYTDRRQLKSINSRTGAIKTLLSNLKTTVALDFYEEDGVVTLFWTDLTDDCIYRHVYFHNFCLVPLPFASSPYRI